MAAQGDSTRAILYALGANLAIFASKLAAALVTGASSMLAEAVHSLADCGNQVLLLVGMRRARRPPDPEFPLGYGKAIYFWSFLVALILFSAGGVFSLYEGWHKLQQPEAIRHAWVALLVLGFGIAAESFSMWGCLREVNKARGQRSLYRWFRESRQSELIVIFGEDLAALLGLTLAFVAIGLTLWTGDPRWDAYGTLGIGVLLVLVAIFVGVEVKALLIGQSVDAELRRQIHDFLQEAPDVERVLNLITLQLGEDIMVAVKAKMMPVAGADFLIRSINRTEAALRAQFPTIRWCFFEPDDDD
ncbi:MAG: cation diffusion facilitator family transporter [Lysobacterales bacterium]